MSSTGGCSKPSTSTPISWFALSDIGPLIRFMPLPRSQPSARSRSARATSTSSTVSKNPK